MRRLLLIFLFTYCLHFAQAQTDSLLSALSTEQTDSTRIDLLLKLSEAWAAQNLDSSLKYATDAKQIAQNRGYLLREALAAKAAGIAYGYAYEPEAALPFFNQAIRVYRKLEDPEGIGDIYLNSGANYHFANLPDSAMINYQRAERFYREAGNAEKLGRVTNNIALLFKRLGSTEEAIHYLRKSISYKQQTGSVEGVMNTEINLSSFYFNADRYDSALYYARSALRKSRQLNDADVEAASLINLSEVLAQTGKADSAIIYSTRAWFRAKESKLTGRQVTASAMLAQLFEGRENCDSAVHYATLTVSTAENRVVPSELMSSYEVLARCAAQNGDFARAYEMSLMAAEYRDTLAAERSEARLAVMITKYEQSVRKRDFLQQQKELSEAEANMNRYFAIAAASVAIVAVLSLILITLYYRNRRRRAAAEESLRAKAREIDLLREKLAAQTDREPEAPNAVKLSADEVNKLLVNPLTERELEVLEAIADGKTNKEIADALFVSVNTIKTHINRIYDKLNVNNRTQATIKATKMQLFE